MESKVKLAGHAIHPMLIVLPLGLLVMAVIFDIIWLATGTTTLPTVAFWDIGAGIITGLVSAVFGFVDWLAIPANTRAKAVGLWHGGGNVVVVLLFAGSWLLRQGAVDHVPGTFALVLSFAGVVLGAVTGWLGGELVERLRVGVDDGAHLDAPNSLSGPATSTQEDTTARRQERMRAA